MMLPIILHLFVKSERLGFQFSRSTMLIAACVLATTLSSSASASESIPEEALDCLIEPWVVSDVGSPVQGVIDKLLVDRGDRVARGQPVAQLESGVESSEVALAEMRATTESEIKAREADLKLAKMELARLRDLYQQNMVSAQQRDESASSYQIASAALTLAFENRKIQQLELKT